MSSREGKESNGYILQDFIISKRYFSFEDSPEQQIIKCHTDLFYFFLTVNLHLGTAARSEVNLSKWFKLAILVYEGMVSEEESRVCRLF